MRTALSLAAAAAILSAGYAYAADETTSATDPDEIVCKAVQTHTGTRLGRNKECHSRREWEARRREDREMTERTQMRDSRTLPTPGGGGGN